VKIETKRDTLLMAGSPIEPLLAVFDVSQGHGTGQHSRIWRAIYGTCFVACIWSACVQNIAVLYKWLVVGNGR
jgi:hypothetical protein